MRQRTFYKIERFAVLAAVVLATGCAPSKAHAPVDEDPDEEILTQKQRYVLPEAFAFIGICLASAKHNEALAREASKYNTAYRMQQKYQKWGRKLRDIINIAYQEKIPAYAKDRVHTEIEEYLLDKHGGRYAEATERDQIDANCEASEDDTAYDFMLIMEYYLFRERSSP